MDNNKDFFKRYSTYRVGTVRDTFQNIKDQIDDLVNQKKIEVGYSQGTSLDKAFHNFTIFPTDGSTPFKIYDYKFQYDPGDNVDTEYNFSLGGIEEGSLESARNLFDNVFSEINYELENSLEEMEQTYMKKWKQFLNEDKQPDFDAIENYIKKETMKGDQGRQIVNFGLENYMDSLKNDFRLGQGDEFKTYTMDDYVEDFNNYVADKMDS